MSGAAWWLLCNPSPAVMSASHCRLPARLGYGRRPKWWATALTAADPPEIHVDVHERGEQADQRSEHDHESRRHRSPARTERGRRTSGRRVWVQVPGVTAERLCVARLASVQRDVAALHLEPAEQHGGVRVALDVGEGVVLAVYGHPLTWADAGGDPHQEAERLGDRAFEGDCPVGERPVQVHRRGHEARRTRRRNRPADSGRRPAASGEFSSLPTGR